MTLETGGGVKFAEAFLEVLVHLDVDVAEIPSTFQSLEISVPDNIRVEKVEKTDFPDGWVMN